jgi:hypothetical protein
VEFRTLVALAATMVCAAMAAHATSGAQTVRDQQPASLPTTLDDPTGAASESGPAIASALAADRGPIQIELGAADPEPHGNGELDLAVELSPQ